jgi:hypothetical protein
MHFSSYFWRSLLLPWVAILVGGQGIESIDPEIEVILVKIGGSSITNKGEKESLNDEALAWFSQTLKTLIARTYRSPADDQCESDGMDESARSVSFVVVHGAGSFGHFSAKAYGLKGQTEKPQNSSNYSSLDNTERRFRMQGVSETRLSVQNLNRIVVSSLVDHGINSVGISPCFGIPHLQAYATNEKGALASLCGACPSFAWRCMSIWGQCWNPQRRYPHGSTGQDFLGISCGVHNRCGWGVYRRSQRESRKSQTSTIHTSRRIYRRHNNRRIGIWFKPRS